MLISDLTDRARGFVVVFHVLVQSCQVLDDYDRKRVVGAEYFLSACQRPLIELEGCLVVPHGFA